MQGLSTGLKQQLSLDIIYLASFSSLSIVRGVYPEATKGHTLHRPYLYSSNTNCKILLNTIILLQVPAAPGLVLLFI
jgi:hypothetical protein